MKKRILTFLLAGVVLLSGIPVDTALSAPEQSVVSAGEGAESSEQTEEIKYPVGGCLEPEAIEISSEEANAAVFPAETDQRMSYDAGIYGSQQYSTSWDTYSSNYIYNQLSESERKFWDALDSLCRNYLTTTLNASTMKYKDKYGYTRSAYIIGEIRYGEMNLALYQVQNLFLMFAYSNPQYYFLSNAYLYGDKYIGGKPIGTLYPSIYDEFVKGSTRKSETAKFKAQIDSMRNQVLKGKDDLEKAKIAHDLIVGKIMYDPGFDSPTGQAYTPFHQSAYSVFCDDYTVCAGYTKSFEILMNSVGIDTMGVTSRKVVGIDINGNEIVEGHAWNLICLNDSWYCIDLTWDDMDGREGMVTQYSFFGVSEARFTGELDQNDFHKKESMYTGMTPKCTKDLGSTKTEVGVLYVPVQKASAPVIKQKKNANNITVTLTSATPGAEIYYTMDGKNPSSSFTRGFRYTGAFKVTSNVTVKAIAVSDGMWDSAVSSQGVQGQMYTVKFDTKGGKSISAQKVWPQGLAKKPSDPKRKGYTFAGWYKESSYKSKWNFQNKITKNTTIYAKWKKVKVANTSIRKLKNTSGRKMTIAIKKVSKAKGYQIRYSTRADMKSSKKKEIKTTSKVISGLKKDVTYYVQVRAYQLDSAGKKVYGDWSRVKTVTIRK